MIRAFSTLRRLKQWVISCGSAHLQWTCMWSVCGRGAQKRHGRVGSFREIVEVLLARCTREELTLAVLVAKKNLKEDWGLLLNSNGLMS
jgi:hypothetical protein